jgi:hypothetical protein
MQVVHEVKSELLRKCQHVALVKDTQTLNGLSSAVWGISFNAAPGLGISIVCGGLTEAANLFHIIEQAINSGEITGIEEAE